MVFFRKTDSRSGFTLIELIIVMGLLAVVAVTSVPFLTGFLEGRSLNEEARRFLSAIRYARNEAMSSGIAMELWLDTDTNCYGLRYVSPDCVATHRPQSYTLADEYFFELEERDDLAGQTVALKFWPDGMPDESNVRCIRIRTQRNETDAMDIKLSDSGLAYEIWKVSFLYAD